MPEYFHDRQTKCIMTETKRIQEKRAWLNIF